MTTRNHRCIRRLALAGLAASMLATSAACGVPLDDEPRAITRTTLPADATPTTVTPDGGPRVSVYFVRKDHLVVQSYQVKGDATLAKAVGFALQGPAEGSQGDLRSSVPPGTDLRSAKVIRGTARIDLTRQINDVAGTNQKEAFAQLVFTALQFPGVDRVRFQIEGANVDAPTDHGNQTVVTAGAYDPPLNPR
ncbi:MAG: GerMN domain-containing protein [Acidimicrobiales bacterium]